MQYIWKFLRAHSKCATCLAAGLVLGLAAGLFVGANSNLAKALLGDWVRDIVGKTYKEELDEVRKSLDESNRNSDREKAKCDVIRSKLSEIESAHKISKFENEERKVGNNIKINSQSEVLFSNGLRCKTVGAMGGSDKMMYLFECDGIGFKLQNNEWRNFVFKNQNMRITYNVDREALRLEEIR